MGPEPKEDSEAPTASPGGSGKVVRIPGAGESVGRYQVQKKIGEGGMGVVLAAEDPDLGRVVALKLLRAAAGSSASEHQRRLLREAQAMARVTHPNLVTVYDVGTHDERVFIAMEYVKGRTLDAWMRDEPSRPRVMEAFASAGKGLHAAHRAGLVHRDFKPGNVIIADDGRVMVLDFGLVRRADETDDLSDPPAAAAPVDDTLAADLTRTGGIMGTPAYMAPEQHLGLPTDARSDQFSFCVALYEALYGSRPFAGASGREVMESVLQGRVTPPPELADVPAPLRKALLVGLARERGARHPDMTPLLEALGAVEPTRASGGAKPWIFAVAALTLVVAGVALIGGGDESSSPEPASTEGHVAPAPVIMEVPVPVETGSKSEPGKKNTRPAGKRNKPATSPSPPSGEGEASDSAPLPTVEELPDAIDPEQDEPEAPSGETGSTPTPPPVDDTEG